MLADALPLADAEPPGHDGVAEPDDGVPAPEDCVPFAGGDVSPGDCAGSVTSLGLGDGLPTCVPFRGVVEDSDPEPDVDPTLDSPDEVAEAGEDDAGGGVGSLHGAGVTLACPWLEKLLVVARVPEAGPGPEVPESVGVADSAGVADSVGVAVWLGLVVGDVDVVGDDVTVGTVTGLTDWDGVGLTLVSGALTGVHDDVGEGLTVPLLPLAPPPLPVT
ncbi:MAG TPA: hypothetical protein VKV33_03485 [Streptosporangiaceae bacterium]|nr:hypothetical protein [Streptosporangiaceae bacterium]